MTLRIKQLGDYLQEPSNLFAPYLSIGHGYLTPASENVGPGDGLLPAQRVAAINLMMTKAKQQGLKAVSFPDIGEPYITDSEISLYRMDGMSIYNEGYIKNLQTSTALSQSRQSVFRVGSMHPKTLALDGPLHWVELESYDIGDTDIDFAVASEDLPAELAHFAEGGEDFPVAVRDVNYAPTGSGSAGADTEVPQYYQMAIATVTETGLRLDRPLTRQTFDAPGILYVARLNRDDLFDLSGYPLFVARGVRLFGNGTIESQFGHPANRTGGIDLSWFQDAIIAEGAPLLLNMWSNCQVDVGTLRGRERLLEMACATHDCNIRWRAGEFIGEGVENSSGVKQPIVKWGENCRGNFIEGAIDAPDFFDARVLFVGSGSEGQLKFSSINAPSVVSAPIALSNPAEPTVGGNVTQPVTEDFRLYLGECDFGTNPLSGGVIIGGNDGGRLRAMRIEDGNISANVTGTYGIDLEGPDHYVSDRVVCPGQVRLDGVVQP